LEFGVNMEGWSPSYIRKVHWIANWSGVHVWRFSGHLYHGALVASKVASYFARLPSSGASIDSSGEEGQPSSPSKPYLLPVCAIIAGGVISLRRFWYL
jgi:hypothetical protein